jgi:hypothetical protein
MTKLQSTQQQSFFKLHSSEYTINKGTQGHFILAKKNCCLFLNHLVVHWPNHGPGVDVKQGAS